MATIIKTIAPVDSISGMIGKRKDYVSKKAIICNISKRGNVKSKGSYMYLSVRANDRMAPYTNEERNRQQLFAQTVRDTYARMKNAEFAAQDMAGFAAQDKYPTLYGYVFSLVWDDMSA